MSTDLRSHPVTKVPLSGWAITGQDLPSPPEDGSPLSGLALVYWSNAWVFPTSVTWGPSELVLLKRLAELHADYHAARFSAENFDESGKPLGSAAQASRISTEMRSLEASLGLTQKARRDLRLEVVSDEVFLEWLADPASKRSFSVIPLDVILGVDVRADDSGKKGQGSDGPSTAERLRGRFGDE